MKSIRYNRFTNNALFTYYLLIKDILSRYLYKKKRIVPPSKIDEYELVSTLHIPEFHDSHEIYLYKNPQRKKAVVKIWSNSIKNYDYYSLNKEALYIDLLENLIGKLPESLGNDSRVFEPLKFVRIKETKEYFALITEYIEAVELRSMDLNEQVTIYIETVSFLRKLRVKLSRHEEELLKHKTTVSLFVSYVFILCLAVINNPKQSTSIISAGRVFLKSIPALFRTRKDTSIVHQDLHTKNILVNEKSITIIDPGNLMIGHRHHDLAITLVHEWKNRELTNSLISRINNSLLPKEDDKKVFLGLLVYHTTHLLTMESMEKMGKYYLDILKYTLNNSSKSKIINLLRKIRAYLTRFIWPKSSYSLYPISDKFGYDRGTPIDRYYINNFLKENKELISGHCLEIGNNEYTIKYGETRVNKSDVLDIDLNNKMANLHGDLRNLHEIATNTFDTIVLTHTLGVIDDFDSAIKECHRILKPKGKILVTVSAMGVAQDIKLSYWRFTETSLGYSFKKYFNNVKAVSYGNVLSGQAFWVGLSAEELAPNELDTNDKRFAVIVGLTAEK